MLINCKNCGTGFKGTYCYNCSQKASTGRLKLANVIHEMWHNFTHTDSSVLGLISALFKNPGLVIREYIAGRRKKYFNPYTFFLVSSAILIFVTGLVFKYEDKLYGFRNEFGQFISKQYTLIVLFSFPLLAWVLKIIFSRRSFNYAEWITFLIFGFCVVNVIQIVIQIFYFPFIYYHRYWLGYTEVASYFILLYMLVKFIQPSDVFTWLKCIAALVLIFLIVESVAKVIALWLVMGVPLKFLIKN